MDKKRIVIVGATSAIAGHCVRLWVERHACDVTLIGRDTTRVERVAADLKARSPQSHFRVLTAQLVEPADIETTVQNVIDQGSVDIVLIAHGSLPNQQSCQDQLRVCEEAIRVNAISPALYAEAFARHMAETGRGTLAVIGSVAGDRGRKSNYVYGASKGFLTRYIQGMQHRFAGTRVRVVLIKPGPTDTPMTAHLKASGAKVASVQQVAKEIVAAIDRGRPVTYVPGRWRVIMMVIQHLPSIIFNKLNI